MYRQARNAARPAQMVRLPRILPLSRLNGATPTRAATCRRVSEPSSGSCASNVRALTGPTPGTERSSSSLARQTGLSRTAPSRSRSISARAFSSQRRWASIRSCRAGLAAWRRLRSATSISSSWRRRATRACRRRVASSGKGRTSGRPASAKRAIALASRRSVLASRPAARAKARTWRGLTTATGRAAAARAAARRTSRPPGAPSKTSAGARAGRRGGGGARPPADPRHAFVVVGGGEALAGGARVDVEPPLGDVDADEGGSLVHDPVSLDAGFSALVTVRVAGTRPARPLVLPRPWWTCGRAGSRRPTRSRYQIGSRQHTKGERGVDGTKKVKGIKRHLLTCSFGFVLAVLVSAANLHDTHGLEPLLERAAEAGWDLRRVKVDAIYTDPVVRAAADRHAVDVQVSLRDPTARGFAPLPVRWRIEATFGTLTNRYRRLTRNLEQSGEAAENVVELANLRRVLRVLTRLDQNLV